MPISKINTSSITDNSVTAGKIVAGAVDADIAAGSIDTAQIADDAITTAKIPNDAVTADKLANAINTSIAAKAPLASPVFTGNVSHGDNVKAKFGTGNDLEIFHDGSHSRIKDVGTGHLVLSGGEVHFNNSDNTSNHLVINSAGIVTKPLQPAFLATKTSTASNAAINTDHTVLFPTEVYDQNSDFSSNTFTAPVTGKYLLTASLRLDQVDEAANYYLLGIIGSNRSFREIWNPGGITDNDSYHNMQVSGLLDMDANDTAIVRFNQNAGNPQVDQDGNAEMSYFCGHLVC